MSRSRRFRSNSRNLRKRPRQPPCQIQFPTRSYFLLFFRVGKFSDFRHRPSQGAGDSAQGASNLGQKLVGPDVFGAILEI
ncbi:hypothetical protein MIMGU_mgv1a023990mg [Erythranthe guttata]|uniref:Uncharacterized protein n=1 Tax=Erythranthe guttata TaxID=4155 RepID=A0A022PX72_ERYGU|nr:hypothetical protein MIMGU_mgv1a023990mg [Erythranthe guttata]